MIEPNWMSVLPPLLAIILAIITRQVILSLSVGIWIGYCLLGAVNPIAGIGLAIEGIIYVFNDAGRNDRHNHQKWWSNGDCQFDNKMVE